MVKVTIGLFCSPSTPSDDSTTSVYFPVQDSFSAIMDNQSPETAPLLTMEDKQVVALEQALSELQTRDVSTQTKLNIILEHIK